MILVAARKPSCSHAFVTRQMRARRYSTPADAARLPASQVRHLQPFVLVHCGMVGNASRTIEPIRHGDCT